MGTAHFCRPFLTKKIYIYTTKIISEQRQQQQQKKIKKKKALNYSVLFLLLKGRLTTPLFFFSCTIRTSHTNFFFIIFEIFYPAKLKKYIMAACLFVFIFISKFTNKKVH